MSFLYIASVSRSCEYNLFGWTVPVSYANKDIISYLILSYLLSSFGEEMEFPQITSIFDVR